MTPEELGRIESAIREASLSFTRESALPAPQDPLAEMEVTAAILNGNVTLTDLPGLRAAHFVHPIRREAMSLAARVDVTNLDTVAAALREENGFVGDLLAWLQVARDSVSWRGRRSCLDAAGRIREMHRRRRIIDRLERICLGLQSGASSSDEALALVREAVTPIRQASARNSA